MSLRIKCCLLSIKINIEPKLTSACPIEKDEAQHKKTKRDLERIRSAYIEQNAASQLDLDNAHHAAYETAEASGSYE